jgi:AAA+ superfamily predicted ATPase
MSDQLELLFRAGAPLVSIQSTDEDRALEIVSKVTDKLSWSRYEWSLVSGMKHFKPNAPIGAQVSKPYDVAAALEHVLERPSGSMFIFKDLGPHTKDAKIHRLMRECSKLCSEQESAMTMIDALPLPDEINRFTVRYEIGWPDIEELEHVVRETFTRIKRESNGAVKASLTGQEMYQMVQTLRGLSRGEAERIVASAILDDGTLSAEDLTNMVEAKRTLLGTSGCLESIAADFSIDDIGGLRNLKEWLRQRRGGFSRDARKFGIEPPRGVLMLGVPGCGKSLCAKVVASDWKMSLLRLDPGVLYQKFIGESESQLRQALAQAEAMAPVVLWVDEIEKAFASASASSSDGGLSKRMFGTLLSWMQDHRHPIFIVATANDISALPPELMRKGRFDEVFFVDLPNEKARQKIFEIHLRRRKRDPEKYNLQLIAEAAKDFSGSEIEQAIISALFRAFSEKREMNTDHILAEISQTSPLSGLMAERVNSLRDWADGRCVLAD